MVIHDETRIQSWVEEKKEKQNERVRPALHLSVVAVQSVACGVLLLLVLLLRVAGGGAYEPLRKQFRHALSRNELMTSLSDIWKDRPLEHSTTEDAPVKFDGFTNEEPAQLTDSGGILAAHAPLEKGTLTSAYGRRDHPINGAEEFHYGVDIAAPTGTELMAVYDGTVAEVGENDALGHYIRMEHGGGVEVIYGHCQRVEVQQGDAVKAGDVVALVGSTGISTGSHVHVSVLLDGASCDPAMLISLERYDA